MPCTTCIYICCGHMRGTGHLAARLLLSLLRTDAPMIDARYAQPWFDHHHTRKKE